MPAVKKGEKRGHYVSRAVDMMVEKEGMSQKAALGKAEGMFSSHWTGPKKKGGKHG